MENTGEVVRNGTVGTRYDEHVVPRRWKHRRTATIQDDVDEGAPGSENLPVDSTRRTAESRSGPKERETTETSTRSRVKRSPGGSGFGTSFRKEANRGHGDSKGHLEGAGW
jgi:hypothetical protein